jgi:predicted phosphoribosyltransferase
MAALFRDRAHAGRELARFLAHIELDDAVVVGLARGGVAVAAEVARALSLPLDTLAVRKIGYPRQPEYGLGAVAPGGVVYVRTPEDLGEDALHEVVTRAAEEAEALDGALHAGHPAFPVSGKTVVLVDDGLATGATMVAAVRWARTHEARRVVVAVPVGASQTAAMLRTEEADVVVCAHEKQRFGAVGFWYDAFDQLTDDDVIALLEAGAS